MRSTRYGTTRSPRRVGALRDLARIAPPQTAPFRVSPALSAVDPRCLRDEAARLRETIRRRSPYRSPHDERVNLNFAPILWVLRGVGEEGECIRRYPHRGRDRDPRDGDARRRSELRRRPRRRHAVGIPGRDEVVDLRRGGYDEETRVARGTGRRRESAQPHGRDGGVRRLSRLHGDHACDGRSPGDRPAHPPRALHVEIRPLHRRWPSAASTSRSARSATSENSR